MEIKANFKCPKCGYEYGYMCGADKTMNLYARIVRDMREGKYGEGIKKVFAAEPLAAVDVSRHLWICPECGKWKNRRDLSVYFPNDDKKEKIAEAREATMMLAVDDYEPQVYDEELRRDYHLVVPSVVRCECGAEMVKNDSPETLKCPKCGEDNPPDAREQKRTATDSTIQLDW